MRKFRFFSIFSIIVLCFMFTFVGCGKSNNDDNKLGDLGESKILVAYFSCTQNTKRVAELIQNATGGDIYRIVEKDKYTADDLNYSHLDCRANLEQNNSQARPEIDSDVISNMDEYDIIFLGYPIWWGKAPKIIYTFLESYTFSGKTVVPFCTSGSSGIQGSLGDLKGLVSGVTWLSGERFSSQTSQSNINDWIEDLK